MAEIALAAAVVQFVDVGWRALIGVSRLCSNLEQSPRKVKRARQQLKHLMDLVQIIQADTGPASSITKTIPQAELVVVISIIQDCTRQATELEMILQKLVPGPQDPFWKKTWRAVISVKNESDILEICTHLEVSKSSLSLWYESRTLMFVHRQL